MLKREKRLKKDKDFKKIFQKGKSVQGGAFKMRIVLNNQETTRFGFIIGLKFSKKAVVRNRTRRVFSEAVRKLYDKIKPGCDIAIMPKNSAVALKEEILIIDLAEAFKKAGIYVK